jgi:antitoxin VapB
MTIARIFKSGNSQAVRLPKGFQFKGSEVYIKKMGRSVILIPKEDPWGDLEESVGRFSDDFLAGERRQPPVDQREDW